MYRAHKVFARYVITKSLGEAYFCGSGSHVAVMLVGMTVLLRRQISNATPPVAPFHPGHERNENSLFTPNKNHSTIMLCLCQHENSSRDEIPWSGVCSVLLLIHQ